MPRPHRRLRLNRAGQRAHPQAPAGAPGPGRFRGALSWGDPAAAAYNERPELGGMPGPYERLWEEISDGAESTWESITALKDRALAVLRAFELARDHYVGRAILEETGRGLHELLGALLPGLMIMLAVLATSTAIGALAGAAVGALAGGVGAAPGAAAGAGAGLEVGLVILEWLGIGFLVIYVGSKLGEVGTRLSNAVSVAWDAGRSGRSREADIDSAAREIAASVAILFRLILEGIVLYLTARGVAAAAERLPGLISKLRASRLGKGFADWVERNYRSLIEDPKLNPKLRQRVDPRGSDGSGGAAGSSKRPGTGTETPRPKPLDAVTVRRLTAEEANARHVAAKRRPPYAEGTMAEDIQLTRDTRFVRVHGEENQARSWMMRAEDIEGLSPAQIKDRFALPETPSYVSDVNVPAGQQVRVGTVGAQEGWGAGGATQYELLGRLPESAFTNRRPLK